MEPQGRGCRGQEEEQVHALGGPGVYLEEQRHYQEQQRPAAYAPGADRAAGEAQQGRQEPCFHGKTSLS